MNRQVNLTKRVKTKSGLRYCPVVLAANGRIKPNYVLVDGKQEAHPEGAYYLEWRNGLHRVRASVGKDVADAAAKRHRKEAELNAVNSGVTVVSPEAQGGRRSLPTTIADYLSEIKLTKKPKTHSAYSTALEYFQESCPKFCLEDLDRKDLLKFAAFLRDDKEQSQRSCWNKFANLMTFLKAQGIRGLAGKELGRWDPDRDEVERFMQGLQLARQSRHEGVRLGQASDGVATAGDIQSDIRTKDIQIYVRLVFGGVKSISHV